ncbi:MAG: hypothetical protein ACRDKW_10185 [Actinomycetota bacterium]
MIEDTQIEPGVRTATAAATRRRRLARAGMAVGLAAMVAFGGACRRSSSNEVDPGLKTYVDNYNAAVDDMAEAAGGRDKPLQESCKQALTALEANAAKLTDTPDDQLDRLAQEFVEERREAYTKCAETGESPSASRKTVEMEARIRELNQ